MYRLKSMSSGIVLVLFEWIVCTDLVYYAESMSSGTVLVLFEWIVSTGLVYYV